MEEIKNIIENIIDNIIDNILTKSICKNCLEKETKDWKTKYCEWCGYNIYLNAKKGIRQ